MLYRKMLSELESVIDRFADTFIQEVTNKIQLTTFLSLKRSVQNEQLKALWKEMSNPKPAAVVLKPVVPKKRKSAYQNFFAIERKRIHGLYPNLSFGELSKMISHEWKQLNTEQKKNYDVQPESESDKVQTSKKDKKKEEEDEEGVIEFTDVNCDNQRSTFEEDEMSVDEEDEEDFLFDEEEIIED